MRDFGSLAHISMKVELDSFGNGSDLIFGLRRAGEIPYKYIMELGIFRNVREKKNLRSSSLKNYSSSSSVRHQNRRIAVGVREFDRRRLRSTDLHRQRCRRVPHHLHRRCRPAPVRRLLPCARAHRRTAQASRAAQCRQRPSVLRCVRFAPRRRAMCAPCASATAVCVHLAPRHRAVCVCLAPRRQRRATTFRRSAFLRTTLVVLADPPSTTWSSHSLDGSCFRCRL